MIYIDQDRMDYNNDFRSMIQAFFINEKVEAAQVDKDGLGLLQGKGERRLKREAAGNTKPPRFAMVIRYRKEGISFRILEPVLADSDKAQVSDYREMKQSFTACDYRDKRTWKDKIHSGIYRILSDYTGRTLPWGFLTGVRPSKLAMELLEQGRQESEIESYYVDTCHTTRQKAALCIEVAKEEQRLFSGVDFERDYCLYAGIPFCPTRCLYCSFASYPVAAYKDRVDAYLDALYRELSYVAEAYSRRRLLSVYVGGGTPTAISAKQLARLLDMISSVFDMSHVREFTVEAGRPDSITEEKLSVLKAHGIGRISINPQTMQDETLRIIGRRHTAAQTLEAYAMARRMGFDNINMDIITGLPGEELSHVNNTLAAIASLRPESLTVHSLAIKRAAGLNIQKEQYQDLIKGSTNEMLLRVDSCARGMGMAPYYMYRQKNIPGNLENIGYALPGRECLYNAFIMEEKMDIVAVGAGASTKRVFHQENRIERAENVKSVDDYISRIDEMIQRKQSLFMA